MITKMFIWILAILGALVFIKVLVRVTVVLAAALVAGVATILIAIPSISNLGPMVEVVPSDGPIIEAKVA